MNAILKLIVTIIAGTRLGLSSGFLSHQNHICSLVMSRSLPLLELRGVSYLSVALAPTTPIKAPEIEVVRGTDSDAQDSKEPLWLVRLYNDPMNKREFVARCLVEICGLDDGMAFSVMMYAHQNGISVIGKYTREVAEHYKQKLVGEGLTVDMILADDDD